MDLSELRDRVLTLPALEKKMTSLQNQIREADEALSRLRRKLSDESRDVAQLESGSLTSFLLKLVGKYEDRLDREQQEEIHAKLEYSRAAMHLESLNQEKEYLKTRISDLRNDEKTYKAELQRIRGELLSRITEPQGIKLQELEDERNAIVSQITEIKEAQSAASRAAATANSALSSLERAQGWATYDALSRGGIISHIAKYSHIDSAEHDLTLLSSQLRRLKEELRDVGGLTLPGFSEISSTQRAVDFWFDNIFTDLSVRRKVSNNAEQLRSLLSGISTAENALKLKLQSETGKLSANRLREEELLLSFDKK